MSTKEISDQLLYRYCLSRTGEHVDGVVMGADIPVFVGFIYSIAVRHCLVRTELDPALWGRMLNLARERFSPSAFCGLCDILAEKTLAPFMEEEVPWEWADTDPASLAYHVLAFLEECEKVQRGEPSVFSLEISREWILHLDEILSRRPVRLLGKWDHERDTAYAKFAHISIVLKSVAPFWSMKNT